MGDILILKTDRFLLKPLQISDVNENYLNWFLNEDAKKYIVTSERMNSFENLKQYVQDKSSNPRIFFWGIFEKSSMIHIGNIKFELLNEANNISDFGIFIGDVRFRGQGVAKEAMIKCLEFLKSKGVLKVYLGVDKENIGAIKLYEKIGFVYDEFNYLNTNATAGCCMVKNL